MDVNEFQQAAQALQNLRTPMQEPLEIAAQMRKEAEASWAVDPLNPGNMAMLFTDPKLAQMFADNADRATTFRQFVPEVSQLALMESMSPKTVGGFFHDWSSFGIAYALPNLANQMNVPGKIADTWRMQRLAVRAMEDINNPVAREALVEEYRKEAQNQVSPEGWGGHVASALGMGLASTAQVLAFAGTGALAGGVVGSAVPGGGTVAGAVIGGRVGAGYGSYQLNTGDMYLSLRSMGVPHDRAITYASLGGIPLAALDMWSFGVMTSGLRNASVRALMATELGQMAKAQGAKLAETQAAKTLAQSSFRRAVTSEASKSMASEFTTEGAQDVIQQYWSALADYSGPVEAWRRYDFSQTAQAAIYGGIAGGAMGGMSSAFDHALTMANHEADNTTRQQDKAAKVSAAAAVVQSMVEATGSAAASVISGALPGDLSTVYAGPQTTAKLLESGFTQEELERIGIGPQVQQDLQNGSPQPVDVGRLFAALPSVEKRLTALESLSAEHSGPTFSELKDSKVYDDMLAFMQMGVADHKLGKATTAELLDVVGRLSGGDTSTKNTTVRAVVDLMDAWLQRLEAAGPEGQESGNRLRSMLGMKTVNPEDVPQAPASPARQEMLAALKEQDEATKAFDSTNDHSPDFPAVQARKFAANQRLSEAQKALSSETGTLAQTQQQGDASTQADAEYMRAVEGRADISTVRAVSESKAITLGHAQTPLSVLLGAFTPADIPLSLTKFIEYPNGQGEFRANLPNGRELNTHVSADPGEVILQDYSSGRAKFTTFDISRSDLAALNGLPVGGSISVAFSEGGGLDAHESPVAKERIFVPRQKPVPPAPESVPRPVEGKNPSEFQAQQPGEANKFSRSQIAFLKKSNAARARFLKDLEYTVAMYEEAQTESEANSAKPRSDAELRYSRERLLRLRKQLDEIKPLIDLPLPKEGLGTAALSNTMKRFVKLTRTERDAWLAMQRELVEKYKKNVGKSLKELKTELATALKLDNEFAPAPEKERLPKTELSAETLSSAVADMAKAFGKKIVTYAEKESFYQEFMRRGHTRQEAERAGGFFSRKDGSIHLRLYPNNAAFTMRAALHELAHAVFYDLPEIQRTALLHEIKRLTSYKAFDAVSSKWGFAPGIIFSDVDQTAEELLAQYGSALIYERPMAMYQMLGDGPARSAIETILQILADKLREFIKRIVGIAGRKGEREQLLDLAQKMLQDKRNEILQTLSTSGNLLFQTQQQGDASTQADAEYMRAVEAGDMETASRLVKEAAERAGYGVEAWHGTPVGGFTHFDPSKIGTGTGAFRGGFSFATDKNAAEAYARREGAGIRPIFWYSGKVNGILRGYMASHPGAENATLENDPSERTLGEMEWDSKVIDPSAAMPVKADFNDPDLTKEENAAEYQQALVDYTIEVASEMQDAVHQLANSVEADFPDLAQELLVLAKQNPVANTPEVYHVFLRLPSNMEIVKTSPEDLATDIYGKRASPGKPFGANLGNGEKIYYVTDPEQIKSADPVTYDANGRVIPLSERFNPAKESILYQGPEEVIKGFTSQNAEDKLIRLVEGRADISTVLHEMFHVFHVEWNLLAENLRKLPSLSAEQKAFLEDFDGMETALTDLAKKRHKVDVVGKTMLYETAATSFEQYVSTGKAPVKSLQAAFNTFAHWLSRIYKKVASFVQGRKELTPEVRHFFDRMLATEEVIRENVLDLRLIRELEREAGNRGNTSQWLTEQIDSAVAKAYSRTLKRAGEFETAAAEELRQRPEYRMMTRLKRLDAAKGEKPMGIRSEGLPDRTVEMLGKAGLVDENGMDIRELAEGMGMDPDTAALALAGAKPFAAAVRDLSSAKMRMAVQAELDRGTVERTYTDKKTGEERTIKAVPSIEALIRRGSTTALELLLRNIKSLAGRLDGSLQRAAKEEAAKRLNASTARIATNAKSWARGYQKAVRDLLKELRKKTDVSQLATEAFAMAEAAVQSIDAKKALDQFLARAKRYRSLEVGRMGQIGADYYAHLSNMLMFLGVTSGQADGNLQRTFAFLREQIAAASTMEGKDAEGSLAAMDARFVSGHRVAVVAAAEDAFAEAMADSQKGRTTLTWGQFQALAALTDLIAEMGRQAVDNSQTQFGSVKAVSAALVGPIQAQTPSGAKGKFGKLFWQVFSDFRNFTLQMEELRSAMADRISEAAKLMDSRYVKYSSIEGQVKNLFEQVTKMWWTDSVFFANAVKGGPGMSDPVLTLPTLVELSGMPEIATPKLVELTSPYNAMTAAGQTEPLAFDRNYLFGLLLKVGDSYSAAAVEEGFGWEAGTLLKLVQALNKAGIYPDEMIGTAQKIGSLTSSLQKPFFDSVEQASGVRPKAVDGDPFEVNGAKYAGWYSPLGFDKRFDPFINERAVERMLDGNPATLASTVTRTPGRSKTRTGTGGRVVDLDVRRLTGIVNETAMQAAFLPLANDLMRIFSDKALRGAIENAYGAPHYRAILRNIARMVNFEKTPEGAEHEATEVFASMSAQVMLLGNVTAMANAVMSVTPYMEAVGAEAYLQAGSDCMSEGVPKALRFMAEVSPVMSERMSAVSTGAAKLGEMVGKGIAEQSQGIDSSARQADLNRNPMLSRARGVAEALSELGYQTADTAAGLSAWYASFTRKLSELTGKTITVKGVLSGGQMSEATAEQIEAASAHAAGLVNALNVVGRTRIYRSTFSSKKGLARIFNMFTSIPVNLTFKLVTEIEGAVAKARAESQAKQFRADIADSKALIGRIAEDEALGEAERNAQIAVVRNKIAADQSRVDAAESVVERSKDPAELAKFVFMHSLMPGAVWFALTAAASSLKDDDKKKKLAWQIRMLTVMQEQMTGGFGPASDLLSFAFRTVTGQPQRIRSAPPWMAVQKTGAALTSAYKATRGALQGQNDEEEVRKFVWAVATMGSIATGLPIYKVRPYLEEEKNK